MKHHHQRTGIGLTPALDPCRVCGYPPANHRHQDVPDTDDRTQAVHPREEKP